MEQIEMSIKTELEAPATSPAHSDIENDLNFCKQDPGLLQSVKCEPSFTNDALLKEEILEDTSYDNIEQQCAEVASTSTGDGSLYEANSISQGDWINVKSELEEMDIGPTVLQHMDIHYALNKSNVDGCSKAMRCSRVKEDAEEKLGDHKAISHNCDQRVNYDEAHMKSHHGQQKNLQKHLLDQHPTTSYNNLKCDSTFDKPHLLNVRNNRHQRNSRKAVKARGAIASLSDRSADKRTKTKQKPFECEVCEKQYSSKAGLNLHKRSHSSVELKNSLVKHETHRRKKHCDAKFAQCGDLTKNMRGHTRDKAYQCEICDARFAKSGNFTQHMKGHTNVKPYQCNMCDAKFARNCHLNRHVKAHTGEKPYQCKICDLRFAQNGTLTRHMKVHTDNKPYQCDSCVAKFARKYDLTEHMRVHTGDKPFQCEICNARFAKSGNLTQHMKGHTDDKPYQCDMCDVRFARKYDLTKHMKVHTGEKPYQCDTCGAKFARKYVITEHMKVHTGEKPYRCKICDARFAQRSNLTSHGKIHTGEKL